MIRTILIATLCVAVFPIAHLAIAKTTAKEEAADKPADRLDTKWWKERHEQKLKAAKDAEVELLFIGDSITHSWEKRGSKVWEKYYSHRKAFNIGYSGDRTQHVLWRLDKGEMDGMKPKVAVIMIRTNNTGHAMQKAKETAKGIKAIIKRVHKISPDTQILLLGIFPRGHQPDHKMRILNNEINAIIKTYAEDEKITFLDLGPDFLDDKGVLTKKVMPDSLHPQAHGYQIWAESMEPTLKTLLGEK